MKKILSAFLLLICFCFCFTGCTNGYTIISGEYFNTYVYIAVKGNVSQNNVNEVKNKLTVLERSLSVVSTYSDIYKINNNDTDYTFIIDENTKNLFNLSKKYYDLTNGKFDISVRPLSLIWKLAENYDENNFSLPNVADIETAKSYCGLNNFSIDGNVITKNNVNAELDFGGIAKGYIADVIYDYLMSLNVSYGYISIGGSSIRVFSTQENLLVNHPRKTTSTPYILRIYNDIITNSAVSTSGDYEKYYELNGQRYSHIIDVSTGRPADTNVISCTVIGKDATSTDALSTAICCMQFDKEDINCELLSFLSSLKTNPNYCDYLFFIVYNGEEKSIITNAFSSSFEIVDWDYTTIRF